MITVTITQQIVCTDANLYAPSSYDVMIVDPPYSEHVHKNATSLKTNGAVHRDLGFEHLTISLRERIAWHAGRAKRWSVVYSDVEGLHDWRKACECYNADYIRAVPWIRWSMPQLSGDRPPQGCEFISLYWGQSNGRKSWNGPGNLTHLAHKCLRGENKHKAEKPLDQALDLVLWFSNEGETVFDPCAGSGTVGLACKLLNRSYVGLEIDPVWAERAANRISAGWSMSERDAERFDRWVETQEAEAKDAERRAATTEKVRARRIGEGR